MSIYLIGGKMSFKMNVFYDKHFNEFVPVYSFKYNNTNVHSVRALNKATPDDDTERVVDFLLNEFTGHSSYTMDYLERVSTQLESPSSLSRCGGHYHDHATNITVMDFCIDDKMMSGRYYNIENLDDKELLRLTLSDNFNITDTEKKIIDDIREYL